jgi:ArsR family transcriptional regulator, arsenate/arsenite/antimonite-responsive transcriptional repressor
MTHPKSTSYEDDEIALARFAKALGHPARIVIMNHLAGMSDCCFTDIMNELPIAQATVSQHLKELKDSGLIQGNVEPPKVKYCINKENWAKAQILFYKFLGDPKNKSKELNTCSTL